jgi:subtilase family serine protease
MRHRVPLLTSLVFLLLSAFLASCANSTTATPAKPTSQAAATTCPEQLGKNRYCYTPQSLRTAYGMQDVIQHGSTGKGQTIVDIVSYGSPTLQQDMDTFNKQFGLPPLNIQVRTPLGNIPPFTAKNRSMLTWAQETERDVQIMHAFAPDANIIVLASPTDETQGSSSLSAFLKMEQYAASQHLGQVFSQSFSFSEATLQDSSGRQIVTSFDDFYHQTTTQGITFLAASGNDGATSIASAASPKLATTPTTNFPASDPWVTAVGGTSLVREAQESHETAWSRSGGGISTLFDEPSFQKNLPQPVQVQLSNHRGVPDIAADANGYTGMAYYYNRQWRMAGSTNAATPVWAGIIAVANQIAGHALGFINPTLYGIAGSKNYAQDFHAITSGNNSITLGTVHVKGYSAGSGWNAVTGLGTPNAAKLLPDLIVTKASTDSVEAKA